MTTTDPPEENSPGGYAPTARGGPTAAEDGPSAATSTATPSAPSDAPARTLRRSGTDRIGAGVAGGLGEYFGVDPVLFRVLFATAAFFGGAGVLAYVLAWAVIPEQGTQHPAIDRWIEQLRLRRVPVWLVAVVAGLVLWAAAFSWWAPGPFLPVLVAVIVLIVLFGRQSAAPAEPPAVSLRKGSTTADSVTADAGTQPAAGTSTPPPGGTGTSQGTAGITRAWIEQARQASQERRRRAFPVKVAVLSALVAALVVMGVADAVGGIVLPAYFWVSGIVLLAGLLVGVALGRAPWSLTALFIPVAAGLIAFGNTGASLHDGFGEHSWRPASAAQLDSSYRLAFGKMTLDLRAVAPLKTTRDVDVTLAAGQVQVLLPARLNATVHANVRIGEIEVDGTDVASTHGGSIHRLGGYDISHTVAPPANASGPPLEIDIHLADGQIAISRQR